MQLLPAKRGLVGVFLSHLQAFTAHWSDRASLVLYLEIFSNDDAQSKGSFFLLVRALSNEHQRPRGVCDRPVLIQKHESLQTQNQVIMQDLNSEISRSLRMHLRPPYSNKAQLPIRSMF